MPQSLAAEAAVLGSMIIDPPCIGLVVQQLETESFYRLEHQLIYDALVNLYEQNKTGAIDAVLLRNELEKQGKLDEAGGTAYVGKIMESVPSSTNVEYYAGIVKDKQLQREVISVTTDILNDAYDQSGEVKEKLDRAETKIFAITNKKISTSAHPIKNLVSQAFDNIEKRKNKRVTGLPTGYYELDEHTCGLQNGEVIIIAGRPSMGKTSLAMNIVENIGIEDKSPIAVFSLEMGRQQLAERMLCSRSHLDSQKVRKGMLTDNDFTTLQSACGELFEAPIYIDDTASLTPLELRAKARRLKSQYDIKCIILDYLQLMSSGRNRIESRQQEITTISRYLKALARELDIPAVVLSQLNRSPEGREGHRPRMSDLRESGSIEQDADVIMLLHREDYYHKGEEDFDPEKKNVAQLIIAKQRNGPTGVVNLHFSEKYMRFERHATAEEPF